MVPRITLWPFLFAREFSSFQSPFSSSQIRAELTQAAAIHSKSGDVIESVMKPQWWVSCKGLADEAIKVDLRGSLTLTYAPC